jgi:hypothetical protein
MKTHGRGKRGSKLVKPLALEIANECISTRVPAIGAGGTGVGGNLFILRDLLTSCVANSVPDPAQNKLWKERTPMSRVGGKGVSRSASREEGSLGRGNCVGNFEGPPRPQQILAEVETLPRRQQPSRWLFVW